MGEGIKISEELFSKGKHITSLLTILDTGESLMSHLSEGRKYTINPEKYISKINDLIDRNIYEATKNKNSLAELDNYFDDISKLRLGFTKMRYSQNSKYSGIENLSGATSLFFFFVSALFFSFSLTGNAISTNFIKTSFAPEFFFIAFGLVFGLIWLVTKKKLTKI